MNKIKNHDSLKGMYKRYNKLNSRQVLSSLRSKENGPLLQKFLENAIVFLDKKDSGNAVYAEKFAHFLMGKLDNLDEVRSFNQDGYYQAAQQALNKDNKDLTKLLAELLRSHEYKWFPQEDSDQTIDKLKYLFICCNNKPDLDLFTNVDTAKIKEESKVEEHQNEKKKPGIEEKPVIEEEKPGIEEKQIEEKKDVNVEKLIKKIDSNQDNSENRLTGIDAIQLLSSKLETKALEHFELLIKPKPLEVSGVAPSPSAPKLVFMGDGDGSGARVILTMLSQGALKQTEKGLGLLVKLLNAESKVLTKINSDDPCDVEAALKSFQQDKDLQEAFDQLVDDCEIIPSEDLEGLVIVLLGDLLYDRFSLSLPAMYKLLQKIKKAQGYSVIFGNHDCPSQVSVARKNGVFGNYAKQFGKSDQPLQAIDGESDVFSSVKLISGILITHHGVYLNHDKKTDMKTIYTAFGNIIVPKLIMDSAQSDTGARQEWLIEKIKNLAQKYVKGHNRHCININGEIEELKEDSPSLALSNFKPALHMIKGGAEKFNQLFGLRQVHGHDGVHTNKVETKGHEHFMLNARGTDNTNLAPVAGVLTYTGK